MHKDGFIIYEKKGFYREIKKHVISSLSFETPYSLQLIIKMTNGDKINFTPPGLGFKTINEIEKWWGEKLDGRDNNLSYRRMKQYDSLFKKIKSFF